jgi:hypothetical protein
MAAACDDGSPHRAPPLYLSPVLIDAGLESAPELATTAATSPATPLLPDWCGAARGAALDAALKIGEISDAYVNAQRVVCEPLTREMLEERRAAWRTYVYDYTRVMAGCVDLDMPPPGGILAFGPANTPAVGVPRPSLSRSDAALLIDAYLSAFVSALSLASEEEALVEAHLWRTAETEIDPGQVAALLVCGNAPDAGD